MSAPPGSRVGTLRTEGSRRRRGARPGGLMSGLILTAVIGMLVAGVGAALWLQRGTPQPPPPFVATPSAAPSPPTITTSSPATEPSPGPPGGAVAPATPGPGPNAAPGPGPNAGPNAAPGPGPNAAPGPGPDAAARRTPPRTPDSPRVARQVAFPARIERQGCPGGERTIVIAEVESDSRPRSVVLKARGPGNAAPTSTGMARSGDRWYAPLGPYPSPGTVTWQITATDEQGRSAVGPAGSLTVTDCR